MSTRQLRVLVNQAYKILDTNCPLAGAADRYEVMVDELERCSHQASEHGSAHQIKEPFRDNPLYSRFELLIEGELAAHMQYTMNGGQVTLLDGSEQAVFRDQGVDWTLMRHIGLKAHTRRLNLIPQCPMAFPFLVDNPQYRILIAQSGH